MPSIPIVDLGELGVGSPSQPSEEEWNRLAEEIKNAFTDIGFVYLINHGIPQDMINEMFNVAEEFFTLDKATKMKYLRGVHEIQGYTAPNQERLSEDNVRELRESFDIHNPDGSFPDDEVGSLRTSSRKLLEKCKILSYRILTAMALALGLDRNYFVERHKRLSNDNNSSCMRLLYYPACNTADETNEEDKATRCGAHTDYGTITLLMQDPRGGLEVKERGGQWVQALPLPGSILVNAGDILQFWTGDKFRATEHRVLLQGCGDKARQSIVFFVHPDGDVLVEALDGSEKYTPIQAGVHVHKRFEETYRA